MKRRNLVKTLVVLVWAVINGLWLAHVFVYLALNEEYLITETRWIAVGELAFVLALTGLSIERIVKAIRER